MEKAENSIISEMATGNGTPEILDLNGAKLRFRTTDSGTFNIDYLETFKLSFDWLGVEESIEFFKPIGFYYFEQSKIAFMTVGLFRKLVKIQDTISDKQKLVNIYFDKNLASSAIVAGFSAENRLVLNTLFKLAQKGYEVSEYDSLHLTKRHKYILPIDGLKLRYVTPSADPMIQVYLTDEYKINVPILALLEADKLVVSPPYKMFFEKLNEYGVLSYNEL